MYLTGRPGGTLNLLAVDGDAVVGLKGTDWDTERVELPHDSARGLSNRITSDGAGLRVIEGLVLVVIERAA